MAISPSFKEEDISMAKQGKSLVELAQEITRQNEAKKDFIAPVSRLSASVETQNKLPQVVVNLQGQDSFPMTNYAHGQMAQFLEIPKPYYDRMLDKAPDLLAASVNRWFQDHANDKRMVRTMDGRVRALLSDRYRPLDNADLAEAIMPVLQQRNLIIISSEITERRLYIKAVDESINEGLPEGFHMGDGKHHIFDTVSPAIVVANSEIGAGSFSIESGVWTRACTNLAVFGAQMRKYHVGGRAELSDEVYALMSDRTKTITDQALWMQARDLVGAAFDRAKFEATTKKLIASRSDKIEADVIEVVERTAKTFTWTQSEKSSVLQHLIKGGDLSRYGLHAAVTRTAEDLPDYDRASEFEKLGGQIIELPRHDWEVLNRKEAA
jgi:nucleoid-associated protein YgaU